jgi:ankyrin repeat protein
MPVLGKCTIAATPSKLTLPRNFVNDEYLCRWLIDKGASPNAKGEMDVTPMSVAVRTASMSTIRLLLGRCRGIKGGQLLHFAVEREAEDALEVIELLLKLGCPIDSVMFQDDPRSWMEWRLGEPGTPLFTAVQNGKTEIVDFLLSHGANPSKPSKKGRTPLEIAKNDGHTSIVGLLERHCD